MFGQLREITRVIPHALSGNPDEDKTGCPIKTFGHDRVFKNDQIKVIA